MLSWTDILKLFIPIATPFVLLLVRAWYLRRQERRAKQQSLWRSLGESGASLPDVLDVLDTTMASVLRGEVGIVHFAIPDSYSAVATRLAELDPRRAYVYTEFAAHSDICRADYRHFVDLSKLLLTASEDNRLAVQAAIVAQIRALQADLVRLVDAQVEVLKWIAKSQRPLDQAVLREAAAGLVAAKARISSTVSAP